MYITRRCASLAISMCHFLLTSHLPWEPKWRYHPSAFLYEIWPFDIHSLMYFPNFGEWWVSANPVDVMVIVGAHFSEEIYSSWAQCLIRYVIIWIAAILCVILIVPKHVAAQPLDCDESPKQKSPPCLGVGLLHSRSLFLSPVAQLQANVPHSPQLPFSR